MTSFGKHKDHFPDKKDPKFQSFLMPLARLLLTKKIVFLEISESCSGDKPILKFLECPARIE